MQHICLKNLDDTCFHSWKKCRKLLIKWQDERFFNACFMNRDMGWDCTVTFDLFFNNFSFWFSVCFSDLEIFITDSKNKRKLIKIIEKKYQKWLCNITPDHGTVRITLHLQYKHIFWFAPKTKIANNCTTNPWE